MNRIQEVQKALETAMVTNNNGLRYECSEQMTSALRTGTTLEAIKFLHFVYCGLNLTDTKFIIEAVRKGENFIDVMHHLDISK